jgi:16S rRNA (guanine966-N2)-methyltransferase
LSVASPKAGAAPARAAYPGKVRIIGGAWRGRKLPVLEQAGLRPTPDRVRETLFNWLAPVIEGARCLDLFAGTGANCLEALSRGAAEAVMVEHARHVAAQLRQNVATLNALGAEVVETDALDYLKRAVQPFDIIFLDPPFASDLIARCSALIEERGWLKPGGLVYVEAPRAMQPLPLPASWETAKSKQAGQVGYHLLRAPG